MVKVVTNGLRLDWLTRLADMGIEIASGKVANNTGPIEELLTAWTKLARQHQCDEVRVICASTGAHHRSLMRLASQHGMRTALTSGEAVAKLRVVEGTDSGKTDEKDLQAILNVALVGAHWCIVNWMTCHH